jgi:hypothetical protein
MQDLREVLPLLAERLQVEDQLLKAEAAGRKSKKRQAANA